MNVADVVCNSVVVGNRKTTNDLLGQAVQYACGTLEVPRLVPPTSY